MTYVGRDGRENYASFRWRRPVVVLVDEGTRSGKEVVTYGLKRQGVRVVGTRTAGALLAGRGFLLRDGSLLVLAVADVRVEGERLEGRGVMPDVVVPFRLPYAAGRDPQLEAALAELAQGSRPRERSRAPDRPEEALALRKAHPVGVLPKPVPTASFRPYTIAFCVARPRPEELADCPRVRPSDP